MSYRQCDASETTAWKPALPLTKSCTPSGNEAIARIVTNPFFEEYRRKVPYSGCERRRISRKVLNESQCQWNGEIH
jgi:hypothetical protein